MLGKRLCGARTDVADAQGKDRTPEFALFAGFDASHQVRGRFGAHTFQSGHIVGTQHLPLHQLLSRIDEVPDDRQVWLHCAAGYRASIGASILAAAGRDVVLVDGDFYPNAITAGLELAAQEPAHA